MSDGAVIAARILESDGEPFATLSLANGLPPVTISTAIADARRNYMRLAALIHPDKIKGEFEKSTEAFQCLVKAFETFVDPKLRKRAAAVLEKSKKQGTAEVKAKSDKKQRDKTDRQKHKAKHKIAAFEKAEVAKHDKSAEVAKRKKKTKVEEEEEEEEDDDDFVEKDSEEEESSDEDEDEDESQAGEDGEDWEDKFLADDVEPSVSTSRTPIGIPRVGGVYTQTIIGCPNCRTRWEPDSKPQYSLFMGKWGKKVHCQLCLFVFGSASALHNCPHCNTAFDYDASMYDSTITCVGCKREIGFPYYPVNQMLIDNLALEQWRARKEAEKIKEREMRARQRHGLGIADHNTFRSSGNNNNKSSSSNKAERAAENEEEMLTLVGTCVVEDECPLCHQRIKRNHRTHVEECIKLTPEQRKEAKRTRKATANDNISSSNPHNSKKEVVQSTRKRARPATTQTKESEDSVNNINAKVTQSKTRQTAKLPSTSSSTAKGSKSGSKQRNNRQRRRGKRNDSDDESEEEELSDDDDSEDNDESDEEEEFTESDDDDDDDDDEE